MMAQLGTNPAGAQLLSQMQAMLAGAQLASTQPIPATVVGSVVTEPVVATPIASDPYANSNNVNSNAKYGEEPGIEGASHDMFAELDKPIGQE